MPQLVYSSESIGCGATIQLDNREVCLISVAQKGVLVRTYKAGFMHRLVGTWSGAIIFEETNVYKAAKTAMALAANFKEQPSLDFKNPVLKAFANAVWSCSTAAEAARVLNEANGV